MDDPSYNYAWSEEMNKSWEQERWLHERYVTYEQDKKIVHKGMW